MSGLTSALGGLFGGGPSDAEIAAAEALKANTAAVQKNMDAARRLADNLSALSDATVNLPFDTLLQALLEGRSRIDSDTPGKDGEESGPTRTRQETLNRAIANFGLSMEDVRATADALGLDFKNLGRDSSALIVALENLNTFNRDFGLLQKQFALFDIEGPAEKFASVMDLLGSQVSDEFAAVLDTLTPANFDAFLEMFRAGFGEFDQSLLGDNLEFEQFLTAIGFAESALDGLATETNKATAALRNAPAGFKVTAARFRASDPIGVGTVPEPLSPVLPPRDRADPDDSGTRITVEGDIVLKEMENPREFLRKFEDEVRWRARTGGGVIRTQTEKD